jgi:hypothetical protein
LFALCASDADAARDWAGLDPDLWLPAVAGVPLPPGAVALAGLDRAFWQGAPPPAGSALYGLVPADLDPALIAQRVGLLP